MRDFLKWILLGFIILFVTEVPVGQTNHVFQNLSKKEGLSQTSVFAIAQDNLGFMWFGTRDGLNKYDGYQFKVYKNENAENSLVSNDIRTLYFDQARKELWIGTISGLSKYQSSTDDFINFDHSSSDSFSLSNNDVHKIFRDSKGRLWIGTFQAGLNLFDTKTEKFRWNLSTGRFHIYDFE